MGWANLSLSSLPFATMIFSCLYNDKDKKNAFPHHLIPFLSLMHFHSGRWQGENHNTGSLWVIHSSWDLFLHWWCEGETHLVGITPGVWKVIFSSASRAVAVSLSSQSSCAPVKNHSMLCGWTIRFNGLDVINALWTSWYFCQMEFLLF